MNKPAIATRLLLLFASGGTFERVVADLPMFRTQIESVIDWMKAGGRCSAAQVAERATHLREVIQRKDQAVQRQDFDLAANMRGEERRIFESFWLATPRRTSGIIFDVGLDEQIRDLAALLGDTSAV